MDQQAQQNQQEDAQTPETLRKRSSGDPTQEDATATTSQDRRHSWEPPALFRTLTQQQREDAHKKFANEQARPPRTIWHGLYQGYSKISTSKMLENKSSVARDHLVCSTANERTFLAWLRTSLSLITVGVAITQLFQLNNTQPNAHQIGRAFGATFVMFSILFLYFANARYFHSQHAMIKGQFPASRGAVIGGSAILFVALIAMFVIILTI
ncbi:hypothetical protein INT43_006095 [Umbelopsis isabellina]|uniref:DUF202 domain-containing protein n=1 Tax=Mortierella isabellina TaxID=91625 RepID=A0A8H7PJK1_MORIS|nr:hypothetical protein INT43_006095 [Umbelopsis isabellina]